MKIRARIVCFLGIVLVSLLAGTTVWAGRVLVIANKSVPVDSLDRNTVSDIYMGNRTKWHNGDTIRVVMLKEGSTRERFVREIVRTTPAEVRNFWEKVVFTGTGTPPKVLKAQADLIEFVAGTRGAIGYIDSSASHGEAVKVISIK